ncbi:MAG: hypothetical protein HFI62_06660 [Lachnospiraceae bacterium]|nr:hypothetical protein [Lachnospiraceae bacterium]
MDRAEFMSRLTASLSDVLPMEREEAIQYYNDYFDDAGEENEQGVLAALGSPEELAKSIKAGLLDGGSTGEFTESGFRSYEEQRRNEIMRTQDMAGGQDSQSSGPQQQFSGQQYSQGRAANQGSAYGNPNAQGNAYSGSNVHGNTYGGSGSQSNPYGGPDAQRDSYGQSMGKNQPPKRMSGGMIALIVILAVLSSPVWIGILGGLFGGSVGLLAGLFGIFLAFLVVGVVMIVVGIALIVTGIVGMFGAPLAGMSLIGVGLVLAAIGLVFLWLMVLVVGTAIPALIRGIVSLCRRMFYKGGAQA